MDYRESHQDRGDGYDAMLAADPFDTYMDRWEARHTRELVPRLFPAKIPRYLDFACGTGRLTSVIAPLATETVGVDISASMLKVAVQKLPSARFVCGDLTTERVPLGSFDLVSAFRFFGNAQADLRTAALRTLNQLLRPGGYLLANNHRNPLAVAQLLARSRARPEDASEHGAGNTLTHRAFAAMLGTAGFSIAEVRPIAVWQYRARLMARAGSDPAREERLERLFGARVWATWAPDTVILARKDRDLDRAST